MRLFEDFFDDIDQENLIDTTEEITIDDKSNKRHNDPNEIDKSLTKVICFSLINSGGLTNAPYSTFESKLKQIKSFLDFLSDIVEDYSIMTSKPNHNYYLKDNNELSIEEFSKLIYNKKFQKGTYIAITLFFDSSSDKKLYSDTIYKKIIDRVCQTITMFSDYSSCKVALKENVSFHYTPNRIEDNNIRILGIILNHIDDRIKTDDVISKFNVRKAPKPNLSYTGPAILSSESEKQIEDFEYGDVLYYKTGAGLVSQETDYPVAICVRNRDESHPGTKICTFMSIRFATRISPEIGQASLCNLVLGAIRTVNPQTAYDIMNNVENYDDNWNKNSLQQMPYDKNWSVAWNAVWRYSPYCTQKGNWYIPTYLDLKASIPDKKHWNKIESTIEELR